MDSFEVELEQKYIKVVEPLLILKESSGKSSYLGGMIIGGSLCTKCLNGFPNMRTSHHMSSIFGVLNKVEDLFVAQPGDHLGVEENNAVEFEISMNCGLVDLINPVRRNLIFGWGVSQSVCHIGTHHIVSQGYHQLARIIWRILASGIHASLIYCHIIWLNQMHCELLLTFEHILAMRITGSSYNDNIFLLSHLWLFR